MRRNAWLPLVTLDDVAAVSDGTNPSESALALRLVPDCVQDDELNLVRCPQDLRCLAVEPRISFIPSIFVGSQYFCMVTLRNFHEPFG